MTTIDLERSQYRTIVLKLNKKGTEKCVWPPTGIVINKKKEKTQSSQIIDPIHNQESKYNIIQKQIKFQIYLDNI